MDHACLSLRMQNKCERLVYSLHELETQLNEMTTNNELLRRQLDDEAEKFQFVKVLYVFELLSCINFLTIHG